MSNIGVGTNFNASQTLGAGANERGQGLSQSGENLGGSQHGRTSNQNLGYRDTLVSGDVLGKDLGYTDSKERIKISAQKLFLDELADSGLEDLNASQGIELAARLVNGLIDSPESEFGILDQEEKNALKECMEVLEKVGNFDAESREKFKKEYGGFLGKVNEAIEAILKNLDHKKDPLDGIKIEGMPNSMLEKIKKYINENFTNYGSNGYCGNISPQEKEGWVLSLCGESESGEPKKIYDKLESEGMVYLPSGWVGSDGKEYFTYVILENTESGIFAYEINAGAANLDLKKVKRDKETIYSKRGTPGRTTKFKDPEEARYFIGEVLDLRREDGSKKGDDRERKYKEMWDEREKDIEENSKDSHRPDFTARLHNSGNGVMGATNILVRTVLQYALAGKKEDVNNPRVKDKASRLYHLLEIYGRLQVLQSCFVWHKSNATKISLDSLAMLKNGVESLGNYIKEHEKELITSNERKFIDKIKIFNKGISKYAAEATPAEKEKVQCQGAFEPSQDLKKVANEVKEYTKVSEVSSQREVLSVQHVALDAEKIRKDPKIALEKIKIIANLEDKGIWDSDKIKTNQELAIEILNSGHSTILWTADIIKSRENEAINLLNSTDRQNALRMHEYTNQAIALLRAIPLPNDSAWGDYIGKLNDSDRRVFMHEIDKIVDYFSKMPLVRDYARGSSQRSGDDKAKIINQLLDRKNLIFPHYELAPIINAITKARIISFELAKKDPFLGKNIDGCYLDHSWFETFCGSGINFPINGEDCEEQIKLCNYINNNKIGSVLFDYVNGKDLATGPWKDATIKFYDSLVFNLLGREELRPIVEKTIREVYFWGDPAEKKRVIDLFLDHPGLYFYGDYGSNSKLASKFREEIVKKFRDNSSKSSDLDTLEHFRYTMFYHFPLNNDVFNISLAKCPMFGVVQEFGNPFKILRGGLALEAENNSQIQLANCAGENLKEEEKTEEERIKNNKFPNIASSINKVLSSPDSQSFALLNLLGDNLELCNGFYETSDRQNVGYRDDSFKFNLWLQSFNRVLYPGQYNEQEYGYKISEPVSLLREDAIKRPYELLEAVKNLWERGKREFKDGISGRPSAKQLCALVHVTHMVVSNIIACNHDTSVLESVKNYLHGKDNGGKGLLGEIGDIYASALRQGKGRYSYTLEEIMSLRLAQNECIVDLISIAQKQGKKLENKMLTDLCANTFFLQNFDGAKFPKGCSDILYNAVPALAKYWQKNPDQAKDVAKELYKRIAQQIASPEERKSINSLTWSPDSTKDAIGQFRAEGDQYVDLINLRIYKDNCELRSTAHVFENPDYQRLFAALDDSNREVISLGNRHAFKNSKYGDVTLYEDGKNLKIYRCFGSETENWCYVSPGKVHGVSLPACFGGDDFTVWVNGDGRNAKFKICSKSNPDEVLYETDESGYLCDMRRKEQNISPYHILLSGESAISEFSQFEEKGQLIYCDKKGKIQELVMPRHRDSTGATLRFRKAEKGNGWELLTNPDFKLIDTPSFNGKRNLLLEYNKALWLQNTKNTNEYKCLLPDEDISREQGMTHNISSHSASISEVDNFFGSSQYAEADLRVSNLDSDEPSLRTPDALSKLRLAYIFQAQGEYGRAITLLDDLPAYGEFNPDEIAMLSRITKWFSIGHDKSSLNSLVIIKALSCMIRSAPFSENSQKILKDLSPQFDVLVNQYLTGFRSYPQSLQLDWGEEKIFWERTQEVYRNTKVSGRIKDLDSLIGEGSWKFADEMRNLPKGKHSSSSLYALYKADTALQALGTQDTSAKEVTVNFTPRDATNEGNIYNELQRINPNLFKDPSENAAKLTDEEKSKAEAEVGEKIKADLSGDDERQFGVIKRTFDEDFIKNFIKAKEGLETRWNDPVAQNALSVAEASGLNESVKRERSNAIEGAKSAAAEINEIGNDGWMEKTYGAGKWSKLKIPAAIRAYEIFMANGPEYALKFLQTKYPWFKAENLSNFFQRVESYLININAERHLTKIMSALDPLTKNGKSDEERKNAWLVALPILRQTHNRELYGDELSHMEGRNETKLDLTESEKRELKGALLTFEFETGIRPRKDQVDMIKFIIKNVSDPEKRSALIQQIMGSGKTKVLIPIIIKTRLNKYSEDGKDAPLQLILAHEAQIPNVMVEYPKILSEIGIKLNAKSIDYEHCLDPKVIREFTERMKIAQKNRDSVFVVDSRVLETLKTAYKSIWTTNTGGESRFKREENRYDLFEAIGECLGFLKENVEAIVDEVQDVMRPTKSHIVPMAASKSTIQLSDTITTFEFIHNLPGEVIDSIQKNTLDQMPANTLKGYITDCIKKKYLTPKPGKSENYFHVPQGKCDDFADFLCGVFDGQDETKSDKAVQEKIKWAEDFLGTLDEALQHEAHLLRRMRSTFVQCSSMSYGEHYMFNSGGEIVPCHGGKPTNNHYQDPYEALCLFTIATIAKGLPAVVFDKWAEELADSAKAQTANGVPFEETDAAKTFEKLFQKFNLEGMRKSALESNDRYNEENAKLGELKRNLEKAKSSRIESAKQITLLSKELRELQESERNCNAISEIRGKIEEILKSIKGEDTVSGRPEIRHGRSVIPSLLPTETTVTEGEIGEIFEGYGEVRTELKDARKALKEMEETRDEVDREEGELKKAEAEVEQATNKAKETKEDLEKKEKISEIAKVFLELAKGTNSDVSKLEEGLKKYEEEFSSCKEAEKELVEKQKELEELKKKLETAKTESDKQNLRLEITKVLHDLVAGAAVTVGDTEGDSKIKEGLAEEFADLKEAFEGYEKVKAELEGKRKKLAQLQANEPGEIEQKEGEIKSLGEELEKKKLILEIAQKLPAIVSGGKADFENLKEEISKLKEDSDMYKSSRQRCDDLLTALNNLTDQKPEFSSEISSLIGEYEKTCETLKTKEGSLKQGKNDDLERIKFLENELGKLWKELGGTGEVTDSEGIVRGIGQKEQVLYGEVTALSKKRGLVESFKNKVTGEIEARFKNIKGKYQELFEEYQQDYSNLEEQAKGNSEKLEEKTDELKNLEEQRELGFPGLMSAQGIGEAEEASEKAEKEANEAENAMEKAAKKVRKALDAACGIEGGIPGLESKENTFRKELEDAIKLFENTEGLREAHKSDSSEEIKNYRNKLISAKSIISKQLREFEAKENFRFLGKKIGEIQDTIKGKNISAEKLTELQALLKTKKEIERVEEEGGDILGEENLKLLIGTLKLKDKPKSGEIDGKFVAKKIQEKVDEALAEINRVIEALGAGNKVNELRGKLDEVKDSIEQKMKELESIIDSKIGEKIKAFDEKLADWDEKIKDFRKKESELEGKQNKVNGVKRETDGKIKKLEEETIPALKEAKEKIDQERKTKFENLRGAYDELLAFSRALDAFDGQIGTTDIGAFDGETWESFEKGFRRLDETRTEDIFNEIPSPDEFKEEIEELIGEIENKIGRSGKIVETFNGVIARIESAYGEANGKHELAAENFRKASEWLGETKTLKEKVNGPVYENLQQELDVLKTEKATGLEKIQNLYVKLSKESQRAKAYEKQVNALNEVLRSKEDIWENYKNEYGSGSVEQEDGEISVPEVITKQMLDELLIAANATIERAEAKKRAMKNGINKVKTSLNTANRQIIKNFNDLSGKAAEFSATINQLNTLIGLDISKASLEELEKYSNGINIDLLPSQLRNACQAWEKFTTKAKRSGKAGEKPATITELDQLLENLDSTDGPLASITEASNKIPSVKEAGEKHKEAGEKHRSASKKWGDEKAENERAKKSLEAQIGELSRKKEPESKRKLSENFYELRSRVDIFSKALPKLNELINNVPDGTSSYEKWNAYFNKVSNAVPQPVEDDSLITKIIKGVGSLFSGPQVDNKKVIKLWETFLNSVKVASSNGKLKEITEGDINELGSSLSRLNGLITSDVTGDKLPSVDSASEAYSKANETYKNAFKAEKELRDSTNKLNRKIYGEIINEKTGKRGDCLKSQLDTDFKTLSNQFTKIFSEISDLSNNAFPGEDASLEALKSYLEFIGNSSYVVSSSFYPKKPGRNLPGKNGGKTIDGAKPTDGEQLRQSFDSLKEKLAELIGNIPSADDARQAQEEAQKDNEHAREELNEANGVLEQKRSERSQLDSDISSEKKEVEKLQSDFNTKSQAAIDLYKKLSRELKKAEERKSKIDTLTEASEKNDGALKEKLKSYESEYDQNAKGQSGAQRVKGQKDDEIKIEIEKIDEKTCKDLLKKLKEVNEHIEGKERDLYAGIRLRDEKIRKQRLLGEKVEERVKRLGEVLDAENISEAWGNFEASIAGANASSSSTDEGDEYSSEKIENLEKSLLSDLEELSAKAEGKQRVAQKTHSKAGGDEKLKRLKGEIAKWKGKDEENQKKVTEYDIEYTKKQVEVQELYKKGPKILEVVRDIVKQEGKGDDIDSAGAITFIKSFKLRLDRVVNMQATGSEPKVFPHISHLIRVFLNQKENFGVTTRFAARFAQAAHGEYFSASYETTTTDLGSMFRGTVSMSGTISNQATYPENMRIPEAVKPQEGKLEEIAVKLVKDCESKKTQIFTFEEGVGRNDPKTVAGILTQWKQALGNSETGKKKSENLRIIVDCGAQFKDQDSHMLVMDIAKFIKECTRDLREFEDKHIEYFDPDLQCFAIVKASDVLRDGKNFKPKRILNPETDRPRDPGDLFTFIDFAHTTGTDPKLMTNGHGIMTVNLYQTDMESFEQAIMRERKFLDSNGQTMDLVMFDRAVKDVFPVTENENGTEVKSKKDAKDIVKGDEFIYKLFGRLIRNSAEKIRREQVRAGLNKIRGETHRFIENKMKEYYAKYGKGDKTNNLFRKTEKLMTSFQNFNIEMWKSVLVWGSVKEWLNEEAKKLINGLEEAFRGTGIGGINDLNDALKNIINKDIPADMKMLEFKKIFDQSKEIDAASVQNTEGEIEQEQQQEMQREQEKEQIRELHDFLHGALNKPACPPTKIPEPSSPTSAWNWISGGNCGRKPLGELVRSDKVNFSRADGKVREKQHEYNAARDVFPKKLDSQFFVSENFYRTVEGGQSVFNGEQKDASFLLISWDPDTPSSYSNHKCHFLSQEDAVAMRKMIEGGKLRDCYLCTTDGMPYAAASNSSPNSDFLRHALWMAHTFNADVSWIDSNADVSKEMLNKIGMPTSEEQFSNPQAKKEFLTKFRNFLLLRSKNLKQTRQRCINSPLVSSGQSKDPYASFLIENGFTEFSPISDILDKLAAYRPEKTEEWENIILSIVEKIDPGLILSHADMSYRINTKPNEKILDFLKRAKQKNVSAKK